MGFLIDNIPPFMLYITFIRHSILFLREQADSEALIFLKRKLQECNYYTTSGRENDYLMARSKVQNTRGKRHKLKLKLKGIKERKKAELKEKTI